MSCPIIFSEKNQLIIYLIFFAKFADMQVSGHETHLYIVLKSSLIVISEKKII